LFLFEFDDTYVRQRPTTQNSIGQETHMTSNCLLSHQEIFNTATSHLARHTAYRGYLGGCPVGSFVNPLDHRPAIEGVPVRYISECATAVPPYLNHGVVALKRALLRSRINVYDPMTVELLSCLQNLHDLVAKWEWPDRLATIARQFGLSSELLNASLEYSTC
jgi:hypothetical protein